MNRLTLEEQLSIIEKRNCGQSLESLRIEFGIKTNKTIYDVIKRNGRENLIPNKKFSQNDSYFDEIDDLYKAYWLGFLYADGYVRLKNNKSGELKLKLSSADYEHLLKFKHQLSSNSEIKFIKSNVKKNGKTYTSDCSSISIYSSKMVNSLIKQGCFSKKSQIIRFPSLPENLISHFIRGYFDGDGCIYVRGNSATCSITSNFDFLSDLQKYLGYGKVVKRKTERGDASDFILYSRSDVIRFYKFIYSDSKIFLSRKKSKFDNLYQI